MDEIKCVFLYYVWFIEVYCILSLNDIGFFFFKVESIKSYLRYFYEGEGGGLKYFLFFF